MSKLTDLLDKLKTGKTKMDTVKSRASDIAGFKVQAKAAKEKLDALKDKAPGMADARAADAKAIKAKVGKTIPATPTLDISPDSIVSKL